MSHSLQKGREKGLMTFGIALAAAFVIFLPYLILDKGSTSFRNAMYDQYKANRPPPPDDLVPQTVAWTMLGV